jgi:hypothetical protein
MRSIRRKGSHTSFGQLRVELQSSKAEVEAYRQQADRAEQWLHKVSTEIEDRFLSEGKNVRQRAR